MDNIDFRKAALSAGISAGFKAIAKDKMAEPSYLKAAMRGSIVSVGTDVVGGIVHYDSSNNLLVSSAIAGGLNVLYGKYSNNGMMQGNLTKDFFMGAVTNAAAGYGSNWLDDRGGLPAMISHGVNIV